MLHRIFSSSLWHRNLLSMKSLPSEFVSKVHYSAHRAAVAKIGRKEYIRRYPVTILRADGSTIKIRVAEPREFVQLPVDLEALTEDERRQRLAARKPKVKQIHEDVIDDNFDLNQYSQLWMQANESGNSSNRNFVKAKTKKPSTDEKTKPKK